MNHKQPAFVPLDLESWPRTQTYRHFRANPCTFNVTAELDITRFRQRLKEAGHAFAPAIIYAICSVVNHLPALRMAHVGGEVGYWQEIVPLHTVFHPETETFSGIWSELGDNLTQFCSNFAADVAAARQMPAVCLPRPVPPNVLNISIVPWQRFTAFELDIGGGADYLLPIFTVGRFTSGASGRVTLPLAVRANHAACDGFHIAQFYTALQVELDA